MPRIRGLSPDIYYFYLVLLKTHLVLLDLIWVNQTTYELILVPKPSALCDIALQFAHLEIF